MAKHQPITELQPAQLIDGTYAIQNCQLGQTRGGKPYIKCMIADKTGRLPARMWNATEELFRKLPTNGFVWIEGQTQPYQGELQIIIQQIGPVEPSQADLAELIPTTRYDVEEMFAEVRIILTSLENQSIRVLVQAYLEDSVLMSRFRQAPAAQSLHHAFLGGLLEHTLSLLRLGQAVLPLYPQLNRDIVLTGLFLHDLGKCAELRWEQGLEYSEDGQLVGHVGRGLVWLNQKAEACAAAGTPIPPAILRVLEHIILSHHGQLDFGALKIPATPEAIAVSFLDNLDAKLQMALSATRDDGRSQKQELGGSFTEKIWALDTRLYRPDPTTVQE